MYQILIILCSLLQTGMLSDNATMNEDGLRTPIPDYGFIAYLFSTRNTSIRCTGAIVAESWILNYCENGEYKYDAVRVGVAITVDISRVRDFIYDLVERVPYPGHYIQSFPQVNQDYDLDCLFASKHSVFLDRTGEPMRLRPEDAVWPIVLSRKSGLPDRAYAHFFPKADADKDDPKPRHMQLTIVDNNHCDSYFQRYNLALEDRSVQFCVDSSKVSFDDCCANHAIMERANKLIGLLAWSTACWSPPEPWVFTNLGWYYDWITNVTSWDPLFPGRSRKIPKFLL